MAQAVTERNFFACMHAKRAERHACWHEQLMDVVHQVEASFPDTVQAHTMVPGDLEVHGNLPLEPLRLQHILVQSSTGVV